MTKDEAVKQLKAAGYEIESPSDIIYIRSRGTIGVDRLYVRNGEVSDKGVKRWLNRAAGRLTCSKYGL